MCKSYCVDNKENSFKILENQYGTHLIYCSIIIIDGFWQYYLHSLILVLRWRTWKHWYLHQQDFIVESEINSMFLKAIILPLQIEFLSKHL